MTAHVLISGTLFRAPASRVSKGGKTFVAATLRERDGDAFRFWKIVAFSESAQAELLRLSDGDAVSVQGSLRIEQYEKDGEQRIGFTIIADHVLALRQPPRQRAKRGEGEAREPRRNDDGPSSQERPAARRGALNYDIRKSPNAPTRYVEGGEMNDEIPF